jgi:putative salt-induced outer membrane protein YdiY
MTTRFKIQIFIAFLVLCIYQFGHSQVNTESLRKSDLSPGFHNTAQFDFGMVSGNSEFLRLKTSVRTDYVSQKYYSFGVIQYQRGTKSLQKFINKGFIHVRSIRRLTDRFSGELFVQKEFDDFISLKDRNLIGLGLRSSFFKPDATDRKVRLFMGNGAMWENEKLNTEPVSQTKIMRSTNYLSIQIRMNNLVNLNFVGYYQVNLQRYQDYRVLVESSLGFNLTKSFTFQTNFNLRFDNEPPGAIKKCDFELTNGVKFSF